MRKPRSDARLKTLPLPQQQQIMAWLCAVSRAETLRLAQTQFGVQTSATALTRFYAWWHNRYPLYQLDAFLQVNQPLTATPQPLDSKIDALQQSAFALFQLQAIKEKDFTLFQQLCRLRCQARNATLLPRHQVADATPSPAGEGQQGEPIANQPCSKQ